MFQPEYEQMKRADLIPLQIERLKATLDKIALHNYFYAENLSNLTSRDVTKIDDLQKFPLMSKEDIRLGYPFKYSCADHCDFMRIHMSSGTTGTPIINPFTHNDIAQWATIMARCYVTAGVSSKDVVQITPSFGLFNGGFGFHYGAEKLGAMIVPFGAGRSMLQLKFLKDFKVDCLTAISSYPLRLIEVAERENFDFHDLKLRVGILGAEVWSDEMRKRIEEKMGIETFDIIGMTETGGVGMGIDCKEHTGIHLWEDEYLVEIINPETDEVLKDGEEGEMVVTTLHREGLPLIRYRTGDITSIITREPCACGRTSLRISRLKGRNDDMLKIKGVNFYPLQLESILMKKEGIGNHYQLVLEKIHGRDTITIMIETLGEVSSRLSSAISAEIYDMLGFHIDKLDFLPEGTIPRVPGKAVRVVDKRK